MATTFFQKLRGLRTPVRSLLYLYFIYAFTNGLSSTFIQIDVYKLFGSVSANIVGTMFAFTGIMVGFCVFGYIISHFRLDAKHGFYYSFVSFAMGLLILSHVSTLLLAYVAMFVYGMGSGFFWLTVHTYELTETHDEERDFYSSLLSSGMKLISILSPLCATAIIWLSVNIFHTESFTLLFITTPFYYLLGFFFFKGIREYRPERIEFEDVTHFLFEKRNSLAQIYIAGGGFQHILSNIAMPLVLIYILGTALNVGLYSTVVGCLSVFLVLVLGNYRNKGNRITLFGFSAFGIALLLLFLGYKLTLPALIIFTILNALLAPIMQVSDHVVALQTMESIGRSKKDFYATMILRDFSLWVWRMVAGLLALLITAFVTSESHMLTLTLYLLAFGIVLSFIGARLLVRKMGIERKMAGNDI